MSWVGETGNTVPHHQFGVNLTLASTGFLWIHPPNPALIPYFIVAGKTIKVF